MVGFTDDKEDVTYQERQLYVLQWPEDGRPSCPRALKEMRACTPICSSGENCVQPCYTYTWAVQEWGPCVLPENTDCGPGYRTRGEFVGVLNIVVIILMKFYLYRCGLFEKQ